MTYLSTSRLAIGQKGCRLPRKNITEAQTVIQYIKHLLLTCVCPKNMTIRAVDSIGWILQELDTCSNAGHSQGYVVCSGVPWVHPTEYIKVSHSRP